MLEENITIKSCGHGFQVRIQNRIKLKNNLKLFSTPLKTGKIT